MALTQVKNIVAGITSEDIEFTPAESGIAVTNVQAKLRELDGIPYAGIASGTQFVFVGDSKTDGPTDPTSYPYYFSQLATSANLGTVYNLGVSGYTLANLVSNYTANVKPYAPGQANNLTSIPTVLSVWIGANDLYQLVTNGYANANAYYTALYNYMATAITDGFRVMLFTVDARGDYVDGTTEFYRAGVNAAIRHNTQATWIVDPEAVFWDYTDTTWWNADTIHYVATGYERLAKLVAQTLLSGGATGDLNSPKINKTNTWSKPQAFTGGTSYMSGAAGSARGWYFMTALVARFFAYINATAESGANAGSDFCLDRYTDAGALLESETVKVTRSTGIIQVKHGLRSISPTDGIGYSAGAGGTVAQATSKATGVTLSKLCGQITLDAASLASGTIVSFIATNTAIEATDVMVINHVSGGTLGSYTVNASCAAGSATIYLRNNTAGALAEAVVLRFVILKGAIT
jgi:lysophospholipase L1-like esterase